MGTIFFLHEGKTKTGKPRFFVAKTIREGALAAMPDGLEFTESVNGVVSVQRANPSAPTIPEGDLECVRTELARHRHLGRHRGDIVKGEIVIFEPVTGMSVDDLAATARAAGMSADMLASRLGDTPSRRKYSPVMKFVPSGQAGQYAVHRMTYRGRGGWSWSLSVGILGKLVKLYVSKVATEEFFELM